MSTARFVTPLRTGANALTKSSVRGISSFPTSAPAMKIGRMRVSTPAFQSQRIRGTPLTARYLSSSAARWQSTDKTSTADANAGSTAETTPPPPSSSKSGEKSTGKTAEKAKANGAKEEKTEVEKLKEEKDDLMSRLRYLQADLMNAQRIAAMEKDKMRDFAITKFAGDLLQTVDTLEMALKSATAPGKPPVDVTSSSSSSNTSSGTSSGTSSSSSEDEAASTKTPSPTTTPPTSSPSPAPHHPDAALLQGIALTHRSLLSTLATHGITPFTPTGETFDPNWHEALFEVPLQVAKNVPTAAAAAGPEAKPGVIMETFKVGYRIKERCLRAAQVGVVGE